MSQTVAREVHPPTGITHCLEAYVTHANGKGREEPPNLVVARGKCLEVYRVRYVQPHAPGSQVAGARLEVVAQLPLYGVVQDMAVLSGRGNSGQRDSIILAFRDAKLSVVEWDAAQHDVRSSSLHSFEGDAVLSEGRKLFPRAPRVVTDPQGRCAAAVIYGHHLALLPAMEIDVLELMLQDGTSAKVPSSAACVGNSYVINLSKSAGIRDVRHAVFLHGYTEPVLLVLHEMEPTWPGRYRDRKDTCCLTALSLNLRRKRHPAIWSARHLPSDATALMAVPKGGALLLCQNLISYHTQGSSCTLAINSNAFPGEVPPRLDPNAPEGESAAAVRQARLFATNVHPEAAAAAGRTAPKAPGLELEGDAARGTWLAPNVALLGLKSGQLVLVQLRFEGSSATKIQISSAGGAPVASCACTLTDQLLFMGSWTGDSLLVRYSLDRGAATAASNGGVTAAGPAAKRRRLSRLSSIDMGDRDGEARAEDGAAARGREGSGGGAVGVGAGGVKEEDEEVFRAAMGRASSTVVPIVAGDALRYSVKVMDSLICLGPVRDMAVAELALGITPTEPSQDPASAASGGRLHSLVTAVGNDKTGALAVLKRGLVSDTITAVPLAKVTGTWSLHHRPAPAAAAAAAAGAAAGAGADGAAASGDGGSSGGAGTGSNSGMEGVDAAADGNEGDYHAFLLLSVGGVSTMVLDARGDELQEISRTAGFVTDAPTLAAGNVLRASAAVQVTPKGVRLLEAEQQLQDLPLSELVGSGDGYQGVEIRAGDVQDPYVLLQLTNGQALLLEADADSRRLVVVAAAAPVLLEAPAADFNAHITAACLFRDTTGWLAAATAGANAAVKADPSAAAAAGAAGAGIVLIEGEEGPEDDGDVELDMAAAASGAGDASGADRSGGGDAAAAVNVKLEAPEHAGGSAGTGTDADGDGTANGAGAGSGGGSGEEAVVFCFVSRNDARLEVYRLPSMELVFAESELVIGHQVLSPSRPPSPLEEEDLELDPSPVVELRVESFGGASGSAGGVPALERPVLLALMQDGALLAYQAFQQAPQPQQAEQAQPSQQQAHQALAFRRLPIDWLSHEDAAAQAPALSQNLHSQHAASSRLVRFEGLVAPAAGGATALASGALQYCGVFACGARPVWLVAARGGLVAHPMYQDAPVAAMTPFHNVNCPHGYILAGAGGLKICQLPAQVRLDTPWLSYKQPIRATPLRLSWYPEARLFAVLTSRLGPYRPYLAEEPDGDPHASASYAAADAAASAAGLDELCELRLIAPPGAAAAAAAAPTATAAAGGAPVVPGAPLWRYQLLPGEEPMCIKAVRLRDHAAGGSAGDEGEPFLAVGTSSDFGEDYLTMGRILLFQVTRQTQFRLEGGSEEVVAGRLEVWREYPGPVAAVDHLRGYLVVGVGHRLEMHYRQGSSLIKAAFFDAPLMVTSVSIVKDFILMGDVQQGASFLRYTEANRQLELLGNDFDQADVWAADFLPNGAKLNMVVADGSQSLQVLVYDKNDPDSWKGRKLMKRGAMHVGSGVTRFQRLRMSVPNDTANRQALLYGTLDGGVGLLAPFWDADMYKRLASLQYELTYRLRHTAGLNPRAFRSRYSRVPKALGGGCSCSRPLAPGDNQMLQGDLLWAFAGLDLRLQAAIAEGIGCTRQQILSDLRAVAQATSFL